MDAKPLYQRIAEHYRRAIRDGAFPAGERLPSIRALMRLHHISLSTALQACRELEREGLLLARARSGYFVQAAGASIPGASTASDDGQPPDRTRYVAIHDRVSAFVSQAAQFPQAVNLATGVASAHAYPFMALRQLLVRQLREHPQLLAQAPPAQGHPEFRAVLARRARMRGVRASADQVIVTHGCIEALNLALRAVAGPGDIIAIESPAYYGLLQILESLGMRALEIPTSTQHGISIGALELAFQAYPGVRAVVAVPNLQNPLGSIMADADKARLVALCERQGVPLIEDDTYGLLVNGTSPSAALKAWDTSGNVIFCTSLHKTLAPGMRLGWMLGGRWQHRATMLKYTQSRANAVLAQLAVAGFMASSTYDRHLSQLCHYLRQQRELVANAVGRYFPPGTRLTVPAGGLLLWVELPGGRQAQEVFEQALKQGACVVPGNLFSNTQRYDHCLRISCGQAFTPQIDQALRTVGRLAA